MSYYLWI